MILYGNRRLVIAMSDRVRGMGRGRCGCVQYMQGLKNSVVRLWILHECIWRKEGVSFPPSYFHRIPFDY